MKFKKYTFNASTALVVSIMMVILTFLSGCGSNKSQAGQDLKNVKVLQASVSSIETDVEYSSKLKPVQEISISPKIAGKVASLRADIGSIVQKGQVLFTLDSSDLQAQLQQQQAGLQLNQANYEKTIGSSMDQQVLQAQQAQQNAQIAYNNAKDSFDKYQKLYDSGAVSKQSLDDAKQKLDNAVVALNTANDSLKLLTEKSGPQSVDVASAQVRQAQAGVNYASIQVQNTVITSPISGVVSVRNVEEGEIASSATPSFTVIDTSTMIAEVDVPDNLIEKIKNGQTVSVKINALNGKSIDGVVDSISPAADSKTQYYAVKVKLDNADNELKPGMFARVILPQDKKDGVLTVPNEAIKVESGVSYVYTVVNGSVKKIAVTTGLSNDKISEITEGIKPGDSLITEGQIFLNDGEKVKVVK